jgi:hypothetical protein
VRTVLRIGTWNLDHAKGAAAKARRLKLLAEADADIWVLTETNDDHAPAGFQGVHSAPCRNSRLGGRWTSIWSRLPILRSIQVADVERTTAALIDTGLGLVVVFGTVLPWHSDIGEHARDPPPRNWHEQYRVTPLHAEEGQDLRGAFPAALLCVAGDLNMNLGGPHLYGTAHGRALLAEAMTASGLDCLTRFDRVSAGTLEHALIDHVLFDAAYAEASRVAATWEGRANDGAILSDHAGWSSSFPPASKPQPSGANAPSSVPRGVQKATRFPRERRQNCRLTVKPHTIKRAEPGEVQRTTICSLNPLEAQEIACAARARFRIHPINTVALASF